MNMRQQIAAKIADFNSRHPGWDLTILGTEVKHSTRSHPPGLSLFVYTASGVGFEIPMQGGEKVVETTATSLGAA
ncbi:MAG: hypothetical protein ACRYGA_00550 [Janthinobacterium lividum]